MNAPAPQQPSRSQPKASQPTLSQNRHVPERTCVACRRKRPQGELLRLSRVGTLWQVVAGVRAGRGAYLCADSPECWQDKRLRRAFGAQAGSVAAQLVAHHEVQLAGAQLGGGHAAVRLPVGLAQEPTQSADTRDNLIQSKFQSELQSKT